MSKKLVIIGGVAGGATAAARARRLDEQAEIVVIERGPDIAFANCGLPYHIGGEIASRRALLVQTVRGMRERFALDIRTGHEVLAINRSARTVHVRELKSGRAYDESYDALLLSPGAAPVRPPIPGVDDPRVMTLRNMVDMDRIKQAVDAEAKSAVVVGGGFIGLEMAEVLRRRGLAVTLVELLPQVMPPLDPEIANALHQELTQQGVSLRLEEAVTGFGESDGRLRVQVRGGESLDVDLAILAVGVRPDSGLARDAGLELTDRGAIIVDAHMRTSDENIYAVGDAVQIEDAVLGGGTMIPLAGPANRQARIAADNIFGRASKFRGSQGTSVLRVFDLTVASTGASEKTLRRRDMAYRKIYIWPRSHAGYFPGAEGMLLKLLFSPGEGKILGAQIVGGDGVDKRIDVIAIAIQAGMTVFDLEEAELAYAPPYGSAKDPVNMAGFVAANELRGDVAHIYAEQIDAATAEQYTIIDVRQPMEFEAGAIPGAMLVPLPELRSRIAEIPSGKPLLVYCHAGQRAYYACRILQQSGHECVNLSGGYAAYRQVFAK